jgi:Domain of unknown function (DUF4337)
MEHEIPTEHLHEAIHEEAHAHGHEKGGWTMAVALSTAVLAVLAAIAGLLSGHHEAEALIDQIQASDQWAFYQAKGVKYEVNSNSIKILTALKAPVSAEEVKNVERYKEEQKDIKEKASHLEEHSHAHLAHHVKLSYAVTVFQVSIAIAAIAVLTRKKLLWFISLLGGALGVYLMIMGLI